MKQSALHLKTLAPPMDTPKADPVTGAKLKAKLAAEAAAKDTTAAAPSKPVRGVFGRVWKALTARPDHTQEGFMRAAKEAISFAEQIEYISADHMCEEIENMMSDALNAPDGVHCEFIGRYKSDRHPRLTIITNWGLRLSIKGMISFTLVTAPERRQK